MIGDAVVLWAGIVASSEVLEVPLTGLALTRWAKSIIRVPGIGKLQAQITHPAV
jgi:hypothetical protein